MRYLTCFKPGKSLTGLLLSEPNINPPSSGIHCTVLVFNLEEKNEPNLIETLSGIKTRPFDASISKYKQFDDNSCVLTLAADPEAYQLHREIFERVITLDDRRCLFDKIGENYFLENYKPHITIAKSSVLVPLQHDYIGLSMHISDYCLLKKKDGAWQEVAVFKLGTI